MHAGGEPQTPPSYLAGIIQDQHSTVGLGQPQRSSCGGRSRRSSAGRRSSIVTKPTAKEAKERRESEREPKKTAKSAELAKFFKEVETDEELEPAHSSTSGYKPHFFNGRLAPDKPISG
ncbi:hypothetical protein FOCG_00350 [Fusarium oxysporum f. sp. radicis-lycopersici 26381]|uniref:Uncharacterized protein n=1 Tax=Fusarium oxysporum Fo47 TaxID=660027 RepID=W9KHC2_FUSOX|nr:hypothetical protein FOZG_04847 [Fusarium oxysporum Fo47]EXL61141.1 hypothetical protein FOCG_00350 [Fusarium oxysporum f. sp. radicis-lycopersici 26381]